jgi:16S rRNA (guanine527-N7)-methyltransferase
VSAPRAGIGGGAAVATEGLSLPPEAPQRLEAYLDLLLKWNRVYNLTAIRERERMVTHHLNDSLAVLPHLPDRPGLSVLDVGSGAGLPGIPLAIARPRWRVTLLESSHKKASFLRQAAIELGISNVEVVGERVEAWTAPEPFDVVISRAFSDRSDFIRLAGRHAAAGGALYAMKGVLPHEELAQLPPGWRLTRAVELEVPGLEGRRHLLVLEPASG